MHLEPASCYLDGPSRPSSYAKWWAGGGQIGDEVRPQKQAEVAWCTTALVAQVAPAKKVVPLYDGVVNLPHHQSARLIGEARPIENGW